MPSAARPSTAKSISRPSERPIQLRCMATMRSGQSSRSSPSSSASAYAVIRNAHSGISRSIDHAAAALAAALLRPARWRGPSCSRAPVHLRAAAVDQPALEHLEEEPLVPPVVLGVARWRSRVDQSKEMPSEITSSLKEAMFSRRAHRGVDAFLDGRVLRRQAEGVPARTGAGRRSPRLRAVAGEHVGDRVDAGVPHVHLAGRVREHREHVLLGRARAACRPGTGPSRPVLLPAWLDRLRVVPVLHDEALLARPPF